RPARADPSAAAIPSLTRPLQLDDDDAVDAAPAVERRFGGVIQDLDGLDVFRRDAGQAPVWPRLNRDAVDDVERVIAAEDGRGASDAHRETAVRSPRHRDAREPAHENLLDRLAGGALDVFRRHGGGVRRARSVGSTRVGTPGKDSNRTSPAHTATVTSRSEEHPP